MWSWIRHTRIMSTSGLNNKTSKARSVVCASILQWTPSSSLITIQQMRTRCLSDSMFTTSSVESQQNKNMIAGSDGSMNARQIQACAIEPMSLWNSFGPLDFRIEARSYCDFMRLAWEGCPDMKNLERTDAALASLSVLQETRTAKKSLLKIS